MKIVDFSIRRKVTVWMFTIAVMLFGIVSLSRLQMNLLPDLSYPTLTVRTDWDGAAPFEIENLITKPIEDAVGVVKGVRKIRSISKTGQSDVVLEFVWGTDMNFANLEVISKLDAVQLPIQARKPVTLRFDPSLEPVMRYALYFETAAPRFTEQSDAPIVSIVEKTTTDVDSEILLKRLRVFGEEELKKRLESANGVASVKVSGGLEEEIHINVDEKKMANLGLSVSRLNQILTAENINLSGGRLQEGSRKVLVRTLNEFLSLEQMSEVVLSTGRSGTVYLKDVAAIETGFKEREAITRFNGEESVEVAIYKEGDSNTVDVAEGVEEKMELLRKDLPEGMRLEKVYDQSIFIESAVDEVKNAGIIGGILAIIVLYIFLRNLRSTLIISISIPVSVIATFNLMYGSDISLNIMSLGGIALGIGMLVDNSIVVLENIARYREKGFSLIESASRGASEVGSAVVASTLTTVAVFFPLVFVQGIAGQIFKDQALTVTFSLLASLVVAVTLIPMFSSIGDKKQESGNSLGDDDDKEYPKFGVRFWGGFTAGFLWIFKKTGQFFGFLTYPIVEGFNRVYNFTWRSYSGLLEKSLQNRWIVIAVAVILFSISLKMIPSLGVELIPALSQGEYIVEFKMPVGTPIEKTDEVIQSIREKLDQQPKIKTAFSVAGTGNRLDANPAEGGENNGEMQIVLTSGSTTEDEDISMEILRADLSRIPGLEYSFSRPALFSFDTPIEIEINGFDLERLKESADRISRRLNASQRFADVKSSMEQGNPELHIVFDRDKASALGMQVNEVAARMVQLLRGEIATRYNIQDRKVDVLVRAKEEDRSTIADIKQLIINPESDRPIPLSSIAEVVPATGPSEIRRISQQRAAIVSANVAYGDLGSAAEEVSAILASEILPSGIQARIGGQNEEMSDSFQSLLFALALAVFLVYLVMASQFESLLHPFIILFSIPLALIGVVAALYITNTTISVVVFLGVILLAGIVVNNAIVLVDLINQLRESGMKRNDAILEAGKSRFRPIIMTMLTTTLGLLPLAIGFGDGAELRAPMGITVIGGLFISTLLTLIVIPVMYSLVDRKKYQHIAATNKNGEF